MQIPVLIEPVAGSGYRATTGPPLAVVVEAPTREEALARLKEQLQARLRNGAELVPLDLAPPKHPLMEFAGMFKDDPWLDEWKQAMAEYRRQIDADADRP
jgi:predicted RNase H-like HicB family nuclease